MNAPESKIQSEEIERHKTDPLPSTDNIKAIHSKLIVSSEEVSDNELKDRQQLIWPILVRLQYIED